MRAPALTCVLLLSIAFATPARGADHPLCTAAGEQTFSQIASDGAGGAIVAWQDARGTSLDIYAQRVLSSGVVSPSWPLDGRALCTAAADQQNLQIVADGAGGAIVVWEDRRNPAYRVYAQHVLASGAVDPAWPVDGQRLCPTTDHQRWPQLAPDGAGGAIVTWEDGRGGANDIYAQHVLGTGALDSTWPANGVAVCMASSGQYVPDLVSDGAGGAIVTWYDFRPFGANTDIYAQRVLASGVVDPAWPVDGRALCTATNNQSQGQIISDGAGGAIVTWEDPRAGFADIYAQHVSQTGVVDPLWPANGIAVCTAAWFQSGPQLVPDGAGGAIIAWYDFRNGTDYKAYAQRVLAGGTVDAAWPANGVALSTAAFSQTNTQIVSDGGGGAIVVWSGYPDGVSNDIFSQHVFGSGGLDPAWPADGRAVCTVAGEQKLPQLTSDGAGRAIITWVDDRNGAASDIYAERSTLWTVGVERGSFQELAFAAPAPNPAHALTTLRFELSREQSVRLAVYDAAGRLVRELASGSRGAGPHAVHWDLHDTGGRAVTAGLYFARLEAQGWTRTQRLAVTR